MLRALFACRRAFALAVALSFFALLAPTARADDSAPTQSVQKIFIGHDAAGNSFRLDTGDTAWMLVSSAIEIVRESTWPVKKTKFAPSCASRRPATAGPARWIGRR
ncbi:MAG TPA: hypothetical protein VGF52_06260, partial [Tepidisphaeraceae bacterium]